MQEYKQYSIRDDSSRAASPVSEDGLSPSATGSLQEIIAGVDNPNSINVSSLRNNPAYTRDDDAL